ncbi:MAG: TadE family protein [Novosphingobium sp.]
MAGPKRSFWQNTTSSLRRLRRARSGVAAVEFAMVMPVVLGMGMFGTETAWLVLATMQVGEVAVQVADNASRIGDTSTLQNRRIYEADINDVLLGADLNGGSMLHLLQHGRVIISSVEVVSGTTSTQYIHWQRCKGVKSYVSGYGLAGATGLAGIGPAGHQVSAMPGEAVIFVEVAYDYQPLISASFIPDRTIKTIASFNVRDSRDLTQIYQRNLTSPDSVASCSVFSAS